MIDSIIIPPSVHLTLGVLVLLSNALVLIASGWLLLRKRPINRLVSATLIFFQLVLMVQTLIGIKLLDQGLGILQLYIHYLGGLAPLFFCLLYYWLPNSETAVAQNRRVFVVAALSLFFTVLTFTVGRIYVADGTAEQSQTVVSAVSGDASGNPEHGESLYVTCAGCHGADGEGIEGVGVALAANDYIRNQSDDELVAFIIAGRAADALDNVSGLAMPAWGGNTSLNEQNLIDIVAYLRTLEGNE